MGRLWVVRGSPAGHPWVVCEPPVRRTLVAHGMSVGRPWGVCGSHVECTWGAYGFSMSYLQAGSSVKPKIPSDADVHPVFESRTLTFCTCLVCPCRAFNECVCVIFFRQLFGFLYIV